MKARPDIPCLRRRVCAAAGLLAAGLLASAAAAAQDIRDIRGPKVLPELSWVGWWVMLAGSLITVALAAYAWHRRRTPRPLRLTLPEQALAALEEARSLMRPATAREFGIASSEVIRNYIEKRFGVIATQRTTEEFLQALLNNPDEALSRHRALLADFLQQCDVIKFAGTGGALAELQALLHSARGFVIATGQVGREPPAA